MLEQCVCKQEIAYGRKNQQLIIRFQLQENFNFEDHKAACIWEYALLISKFYTLLNIPCYLFHEIIEIFLIDKGNKLFLNLTKCIKIPFCKD